MSKIRVIDPEQMLGSKTKNEDNVDPDPAVVDKGIRPTPADDQPAKSRKRRAESEESLEFQSNQPLKKKARLETNTEARNLSKDKEQDKDKSISLSGIIVVKEPGEKKLPHVSFERQYTLKAQSGKLSKAGKAFIGQITQSKISCLSMRPNTSLEKKAKMNLDTSPLNPHTLFWNDLFAKTYPRDGTTGTVLNLSIDDLLQAPNTKGAIFDVNKTYLGKPFINLGYSALTSNSKHARN
ncbi:hypothetical protein CPC08DRAFT_705897 [Agrocybe pediades]|nr:hypothetical protein CPC08DRAFT_705897 [Agrocybe pediades]